MYKHTKILREKGTTLFVAAENPAWLHELRIHQQQIEQKIKQESHNKFTNFRARVGDIHGK